MCCILLSHVYQKVHFGQNRRGFQFGIVISNARRMENAEIGTRGRKTASFRTAQKRLDQPVTADVTDGHLINLVGHEDKCSFRHARYGETPLDKVRISPTPADEECEEGSGDDEEDEFRSGSGDDMHHHRTMTLGGEEILE